MNRKNAILLTSAVNGALLLTLFIASLFEEKNSDADIAYHSKEAMTPHYVEPFVHFEQEELQNVPAIVKSHVEEAKVQHILPLPLQTIASSSAIVNEPVVVKEEAVSINLTKEVVVKEEAPSFQEVVVQKGDNLEKIAKKYQTSVDALLKHNMLNNTLLKVGQKLKIPPATTLQKKSQAPSFTPEGAEYYTMKVGDNPWSIAMKHHLKVDELLKLNGLNEEKARKLKPGDRLRIR